MIPKITQPGPNIVYWCGNCGSCLPNPYRFRRGEHKPVWKFCPICGEFIEYDKAQPVQWTELNCERCGGKGALAERLSRVSSPQHIAVHLEWDELGNQLRQQVQALLGADYEISIRRMDYYYWEMKLDIPVDIDEEMSGKICESLDIQELAPDYFIWNEDVENDYLNGLLSMLMRREVESNHADDYGVWVICREFRIENLPEADMTQRGIQCLIKSGVASDAAPAVLKALGHILFDAKPMSNDAKE